MTPTSQWPEGPPLLPPSPVGPYHPAAPTPAGAPDPGGTPAGRPTRRRFLVGAGVLAAAGVAGGALVEHRSAARAAPAGRVAPAVRPATSATGHGILVLVTLYGGNDGLNTVVPYTDSGYQAARPDLGYRPDQVLTLSDGLALNPQLKGFKSLWDAGQLAVVRGVGYPGPSLSHFQSMAIWQTADPVAASGPGWLGRWLDGTGTDPMRAVSIGTTLPPALRGEKAAAASITRPTITLPGSPAFRSAYQSLTSPGPDRSGLAATISGAGSDLIRVKADLDRLVGQGPAPAQSANPAGGRAAARAGALAADLQTVASLIKAGAPTRVYQVSLASFDTHAAEKANHERLLAELDGGVTAFLASLKGVPAGDGVVVMTYSEFGRRVAQNASGGTDHGTAAPVLIAGPGVKGGRFYGDEPSLTDLDDGNLKYNVDFRSLYATMLAGVIGVDPKPVLGTSFPLLPII